jgi:hypothetical protein
LLKKAQAVVQKTSRQNVTSTVFILLKKAQAEVQKTSRQNVTSTVFILPKKAQAVVQKTSRQCNVNCFDFFFFSVFLMDIMGGKITST